MTNNQNQMLAEIHRAMGRMEGQLSSFIDQMKVQDDRSTKQEVRLRKVENRQYYWSGAGALLGAILGAVGIHLRLPSG